MSASSRTPDERARKMTALVLQRVQRESTQAAVAASMGVSEPTVSRMLATQIEAWMKLLAFSGLKVVPVEHRCFPEDQIQALITQARAYMSRVETPASLVWDEDE